MEGKWDRTHGQRLVVKLACESLCEPGSARQACHGEINRVFSSLLISFSRNARHVGVSVGNKESTRAVFAAATHPAPLPIFSPFLLCLLLLSILLATFVLFLCLLYPVFRNSCCAVPSASSSLFS